MGMIWNAIKRGFGYGFGGRIGWELGGLVWKWVSRAVALAGLGLMSMCTVHQHDAAEKAKVQQAQVQQAQAAPAKAHHRKAKPKAGQEGGKLTPCQTRWWRNNRAAVAFGTASWV